MSIYKKFSSLDTSSVVILPTDTVYGLACSALSPAAVRRMYEIKKRDGKPGTIIAASTAQLVSMGFDEVEIERANAYWPAAVSVILHAPEPLQYLHMGMNSLAVRIPAGKQLRELLEQTGPLATTSANFPGEPTVTTVEQAKSLFGYQVDEYIDGGDLTGRAPSQILHLLDGGGVERVR